MEVKEFQKQINLLIAEWDKLKKKKYTKETAFIHLVEEIGEFARQIVNKERRKEKYSEEELKDAIGDIIIQAVFLASLYKIDIEDLILKIFENDRKRMAKIKESLEK